MRTYFASSSGTGNGLSPATPASIADVKLLARSAAAIDSVTVYLRGGMYDLASSLVFSSLDSGQNGNKIYWRAYPGESPVLSGGIKVTGWAVADAGQNIWSATVPAGVNTRQLYVNGIKAIRSNMTVGTRIYHTSAATYQSTDATIPVFVRPQDLEFSFLTMKWAQAREFVTSVSRVGNTTTFTLGTAINTMIASGIGNASWPTYPYSLENAYEFLSAATPGMWYLNPDTSTLYYVPRPGEDMTAPSMDVRLPLLENIIKIDQNDPAADLEFFGIDVAYSSWMAPTTDRTFTAAQANMYLPPEGPDWSNPGYIATSLAPQAAISIYGALRVNFTSMGIRHCGGQGVHVGKGSKYCSVQRSTIHDVASSAIQIGETNNLYPGIADQVSHCSAINNIVESIGQEYLGAPGIMIGCVDNVTVQHNDVADCPYTGVSLGWGWLHSGYANNNDIGYNKIRDVLTILHDGAGIYSLGDQGATNRSKVHDNYMFNIGNGVDFTADSGLYADEGTNYVDYYNNIIVVSAGGTPDRWFFTNGASGNNTANNNYQYGGLTAGQSGIASLAGINAAIALPGTDIMSWDSAPQAIALAAGVEPIVSVPISVTPHLRTPTGLRPVRAYYKTPAGLVEHTFKMEQ